MKIITIPFMKIAEFGGDGSKRKNKKLYRFESTRVFNKDNNFYVTGFVQHFNDGTIIETCGINGYLKIEGNGNWEIIKSWKAELLVDPDLTTVGNYLVLNTQKLVALVEKRLALKNFSQHYDDGFDSCLLSTTFARKILENIEKDQGFVLLDLESQSVVQLVPPGCSKPVLLLKSERSRFITKKFRIFS